jgi:hypothetical protein
VADGNATLAKIQYEAGAKRFMLATINATRELRPGCKVGWYGYPRNALPFIPTAQYTRWCGNYGNPDGRCFFTGYDEGHSGTEQRRLNDELGWLFEALDTITPSIYLGMLPANYSQSGTYSEAATQNYVSTTVQESVRLAKKAQAAKVAAGQEHAFQPTVMPYTWNLYNNYWQHKAPAPREALSLSDARNEFLLPLKSGADGLFIWGAVAAETDSAEMQQSDQGAVKMQLWMDTGGWLVLARLEYNAQDSILD